VAEQGKTMSKAMTRKAWLEYLQKAVDEFDWDAVEQEQPLPPVEIGVDVTSDGASVVAFYRRPNAVMEMFYSQFHPQPKQEQGEPVAWMDKENHDVIVSAKDWDNIDPLWYWMYQPLYTTPQPAQKPLTDEQISNLWCEVTDTDFVTIDTHEFARAIEAAHGIKEKNNA